MCGRLKADCGYLAYQITGTLCTPVVGWDVRFGVFQCGDALQ